MWATVFSFLSRIPQKIPLIRLFFVDFFEKQNTSGSEDFESESSIF